MPAESADWLADRTFIFFGDEEVICIYSEEAGSQTPKQITLWEWTESQSPPGQVWIPDIPTLGGGEAREDIIASLTYSGRTIVLRRAALQGVYGHDFGCDGMGVVAAPRFRVYRFRIVEEGMGLVRMWNF